MYNAVIRALQRIGLADTYGETDVPLYVLNAAYPLVDDEFLSLLRRQGRGAGRRGRPAQLHRAGLRRDAAQGRPRHQDRRQGISADGRRIYRPGHARRHRRLPARRGAAHAAERGEGAQQEQATATTFPISSASFPAVRRASASAARSGRSSPRPSWSSRSSASTTSRPTSAAICSRSCRPSSSAPPPWATGWGRPRPRRSIRRRRRGARSPSSATAASGTTA